MFGVSKKRSVGRKSGQVTLFVIVALVIFFAFAFALYARVKIITAQLNNQADQQMDDYINKNSLNQYVTSCLDVITDDVFIRAAMQGGTFNFTDQIKDVNYTEFYDIKYNRTFNVSILIDANTYCPDGRSPTDYYIVTQQPGPYPSSCRQDYVKDMPKSYMTLRGECSNNCTDRNFWTYSGFFGINSMPILCNPMGANRYRAEGSTVFGASCDYYEYYRKSMQQLIEEEISSEMTKCVNFTEVLESAPSNISQIGNVTTVITFKRDGVIVKLQYPFTIVLQNRQPVTRIADFSMEKNIPYKDLYEYSFELANSDVKDARFDVFADMERVFGGLSNLIWSNKNMYRARFNVIVHQGNSTNRFVNVVQVTDTAHDIRGLPLTITFAARNRQPVLDKISEGHAMYDMSFVEDQVIDLNPQGYDPDEEQRLTYSYDGWLEDHVDEYIWTDNLCLSPETIGYVIANCTRQVPGATIPYNWTNSSIYKQTLQNASYNASRKDVGYHVVRIGVSDREGLYDYQDVRILVFDKPEAIVVGDNLYENVPDGFASREDLYILDGSQSTVGSIALNMPGVGLIDFEWDDPVEPFYIAKHITTNPVNPDDKLLRLPYESREPPTPDADINMNNIVDYTFNNLGTHDIKLTVTNTLELSGEAIFPLDVRECLPQRSNTPIYPFDGGSTLMDHLQANHTCCADSMTFAGSGTVCYRDISYGAYNRFIDYGNNPTYGIGTYPVTYSPAGAPSGIYENDVYRQEFQRYCTDDRGNTCMGRVEETRTVEHSCIDGNGLTISNPYYTTFNTEKCSGPESGIAQNTDISCTNYGPGQTFETVMQEAGATGICTQGKQCFDGTDFEPFSLGGDLKYSCEGYCDGGECNTPNMASCTCEVSCGGTVNPLCDGRGTTIATPTSPSCAGGLSPYIPDTCNDCVLEDAGNRCSSACGANNYCDGIAQNNYPALACAASDPYTRAICDNNCQLAPVPDNICRSNPARGCLADIQCNNNQRNDLLTVGSNPTRNLFCDNNCGIQNCAPYRYNQVTHRCYGDGGVGCNAGSECVSNNCQLATHTCI